MVSGMGLRGKMFSRGRNATALRIFNSYMERGVIGGVFVFVCIQESYFHWFKFFARCTVDEEPNMTHRSLRPAVVRRRLCARPGALLALPDPAELAVHRVVLVEPGLVQPLKTRIGQK